MESSGILTDDPRSLSSSLKTISEEGRLIIPDFEEFSSNIQQFYEDVKEITDGHNAQYIKILKDHDPSCFGVSVCTVDGQRCSFGDSSMTFSVQSVVKPILYAMGLETFGYDHVNKYVGGEPSGLPFNKVKLNSDGIPHNPLNNPGAIVMSSLLCDPSLGSDTDHLSNLLTTFDRMAGTIPEKGNRPFHTVDELVFKSERSTATRNRGIAYAIKEKHEGKPVGFPDHVKDDKHDVDRVLDFYFEACSIMATTERMAVVGATLAKGGVCPLTEERVFSPETVKHTRTMMDSCGMYTFSGEWAIRFGAPAKSGVAGLILVVIPGKMSIAIWSPPLDRHHNSVRGIAFCDRLFAHYKLHRNEMDLPMTTKIDPFLSKTENERRDIILAIWAARDGNLPLLRSLFKRGVDLSKSDYDNRTPLHLATKCNQAEVISFLIKEAGVDKEPVDDSGLTPLEEARKLELSDIFPLFE